MPWAYGSPWGGARPEHGDARCSDEACARRATRAPEPSPADRVRAALEAVAALTNEDVTAACGGCGETDRLALVGQPIDNARDWALRALEALGSRT